MRKLAALATGVVLVCGAFTPTMANAASAPAPSAAETGLTVEEMDGVAPLDMATSAYRQGQCNSFIEDPIYRRYDGAYYAIQWTGTVGDGPTPCSLRLGDSNKSVRYLQGTLNRCYGAGLTVDGNFGKLTRQAVINVQNRHKLTPDGAYGPATQKGSLQRWWRKSDGTMSHCA